jgi:hypothetical protein
MPPALNSADLSEVDKMLIAVSLGSGLTDGRKKLVLSADKGITFASGVLYNGLRNEEIALNLEGIAESMGDFERVCFRVSSLDRLSRGDYALKNYFLSNDFFGAQHNL